MDLRQMHVRLEPNRSVLRLAGTLLVASTLLMAMAVTAPDSSRAAERSRAQVTKALIGTWSLKSVAIVNQDGDAIGSPYKDPVGKLTYTKRGDMWAFVGERDRGTGLETWYTGTFSVRPKAKEVAHHVEFSSTPRIPEGADQIRYYSLRKNRLVLSPDPPTSAFRQELIWTRR